MVDGADDLGIPYRTRGELAKNGPFAADPYYPVFEGLLGVSASP